MQTASTECAKCAASMVSPRMPEAPETYSSNVLDTDWSFEDDDMVDTSFQSDESVLCSARVSHEESDPRAEPQCQSCAGRLPAVVDWLSAVDS